MYFKKVPVNNFFSYVLFAYIFMAKANHQKINY
jgi:hypothetical protein